MPLTNSFGNTVLDAMLGNSATLLSATVELALSTTDPTTIVTEPNQYGYSRLSIANNDTNWAAAVALEKSNAIDFVFSMATGLWGVISHWALYDVGVMKFHGIVDDGAGTPSPKTIDATDVFRFQIGDLRITLE